jgi:class 3 adenylate cyclase
VTRTNHLRAEEPPPDGYAAAGAPVEGAVSFVVTDVAGSTELWEWDAAVMDQALQLHDDTLRALLCLRKGLEVTTEGDSFMVVFHDAADALQWCLHVQQVCCGSPGRAGPPSSCSD